MATLAHDHPDNVSTTECAACREVGQQFFERGQRGFSTEDTWGFDTYLAKVIAGGVAELRDRGNGYPAQMTEDEWASVLTRIVDGFAAYAEHETSFEVHKSDQFQEAMALLGEHWASLWD